MVHPDSRRLMVAGASGQLGRATLAELVTAGANVIAGTRSPERLAELTARGIDVRRVDYDRPAAVPEAFAGVTRLLLVSTDELHTPGKRIAQHQAAIDAAVQSGVRHIVYTSMPAPSESSALPFAPDHVATERALADSGIAFTSLRVAWYAENLLALLPHVLATGIWYTAAGDGRIPYVPRADVARAAAAALASGDETHILDISGRHAFDVEEIAATASYVLGRHIEVRHLPDAALGDALIGIGVAPAYAPMLVATDRNTRLGHFEIVSAAIEQLTGRPPTTLEEFFHQNRAALLRLS